MAFAPAGVGIDQIDQLAHRVAAVADDLGRVAARRRDELVADDQKAVVVAGQVAFDQDVVPVFGGHP